MEIEIKTKVLFIIILLILITHIINPTLITYFLEKISAELFNEGFDSGVISGNNSEIKQLTQLTQTSDLNTISKINKLHADVDEDLKIPFRYNNATYGDNYFLDDGGDGTLGLISSLCSKSCCTQQYPLPFELPDDKLVKNSKINYVRTGYTCNNGFQDTGCLCMTQEQSDFLKKRGQNI